MLQFTRFKTIAIALVCLLGAVFAMPNFLSRATVDSWPSFMPKRQMPLGLDLQGGAHFLLDMDTNKLRQDWVTTLRDDVRKQLSTAKIPYAALGVSGTSIQVRTTKPEDVDAAVTELRKLVQSVGNPVLGVGGPDLEIERGDGGVIRVTPTENGLRQRIQQAQTGAIETINRRVNALGTAESTVVPHGRDRILIQYPGLKDPTQLRNILGQTAKLSFHEVHPTVTPSEARATRPPSGFRVYPGTRGEGAYVLRDNPVVEGQDLVDAQPQFDQRNNQWVITFRFNQLGARKFGSFTQSHVKMPFAIVLDDKVLSAPIIQEPILGGSGQISGDFTAESAGTLAISLRSGALPAKLTIVEERTVGPSLGADSIASGKTAAMIGTALVAAFMVFAYGLFGIFALAAVLINLLIIVGIMSMLGSTLTLPGIAGLVLTVGMAVDANVLIFERIREELRSGRTTISAIDSGFGRALGTILDSNLTTLIAGLVMFWLGSGPIRGFAVTLSLGILTTVFTAFTVTRLLVWLWLSQQKTRKVPAPL